jgi:hypothetical protein
MWATIRVAVVATAITIDASLLIYWLQLRLASRQRLLLVP